MSFKLTGLSSLETWDWSDTTYNVSCFPMFQTLFWCVPNFFIEVTEKSSMGRPGSSVWRSLRTINILMFIDDSSLEVSFLEHKEILLG